MGSMGPTFRFLFDFSFQFSPAVELAGFCWDDLGVGPVHEVVLLPA